MIRSMVVFEGEWTRIGPEHFEQIMHQAAAALGLEATVHMDTGIPMPAAEVGQPDHHRYIERNDLIPIAEELGMRRNTASLLFRAAADRGLSMDEHPSSQMSHVITQQESTGARGRRVLVHSSAIESLLNGEHQPNFGESCRVLAEAALHRLGEVQDSSPVQAEMQPIPQRRLPSSVSLTFTMPQTPHSV